MSIKPEYKNKNKCIYNDFNCLYIYQDQKYVIDVIVAQTKNRMEADSNKIETKCL